jgi:hypothetical protein
MNNAKSHESSVRRVNPCPGVISQQPEIGSPGTKIWVPAPMPLCDVGLAPIRSQNKNRDWLLVARIANHRKTNRE